jgi:hypothetical protein
VRRFIATGHGAGVAAILRHLRCEIHGDDISCWLACPAALAMDEV